MHAYLFIAFIACVVEVRKQMYRVRLCINRLSFGGDLIQSERTTRCKRVTEYDCLPPKHVCTNIVLRGAVLAR